MPSPPSLVFGQGDTPVIDRDYELIKELGRGGFGQVWKASGEGGGDVALKIVNLVGLKEAKRELWALERINKVRHANLVTVSAAYVIDGNRTRLKPKDWDSDSAVALLLVMTLCEKSLEQVLQEHRAAGLPGIPLDELLHYMEGAARGLDYLHKPNPAQGRDQAIVHCDIKPLNILIAGGEPLICDFGLARVFDTGDTKYTTQLGSIAYMPPEVLLEGKAATPPSDQYSLAISYIELRTGLLPFGSGEQVTLGDVNRALINDSHNLTRLEDGERSVIQRAIVREPRNRYPTCLEMVEALWAATADQPKQKSRGLIGKLFGGSEETTPSRRSDRLTPTPSRTPSSRRQPKPKYGETAVAPESPSPKEDLSAPVSAGDDSVRESTAPPEIESLDTAPVVPEEDEARLVTVPDYSSTPQAPPLPPKPRRRMPVFTIALGLLFLGAALVGIGYVTGYEPAVSLVEDVWKKLFPDPSPAGLDVAWREEVLGMLDREDFGSVIPILNSPPDEVTVGGNAELWETARKKWRDVLQRHFDDGEFEEAAQLLDAKLSKIADPDEASRMWREEFGKRLENTNCAEAAELLDAKLSEIADLGEARRMWGKELDTCRQKSDFAKAAQLFAPEFVDRLEDTETMLATVRAAWCTELQQYFDTGKLVEADGLLDAKLSKIADLDEAGRVWGKELDKYRQAESFAELAQLFAPGFLGRLKDAEAMHKEVRGEWCAELEERLAAGKFAEAAQLADKKLSAIIDFEAGGNAWDSAFNELFDKLDFNAAKLLILDFDPSFVKLSLLKYEKKIYDAEGKSMKDLLAWREKMEAALEKREFNSVIDALKNHPAEVQQAEVEKFRKEATKTWSDELRRRLDGGEYVKAAELLAPELSMIKSPDEGQGAYLQTFESLLKGDCKGATQLIKDCYPKFVNLNQKDLSDRIKEAADSEVNKAISDLSKYVEEVWPADPKSHNAGDVQKKCETVLASFPECPEAHLIMTRALMEQRMAPKDSYKKFLEIKPSVLTKDLKHLHKMLRTFVLQESSDPNPDKIRESLVDLDKDPPPETPPAFFQLTDKEKRRLDSLRKETVKPLLVRIENAVDSADSVDFDAAGEALAMAEGLARDEDQLSDLKYWRAIVNLRDPDSKSEQLTVALASTGQFMSSTHRTEEKAEEIAEAMVAAGEKNSHVNLTLLDDAMKSLRKACDLFKYGTKLPRLRGELLVHATKLRIADPKPPKEEEWEQLQEDWLWNVDKGFENSLVEAWMAERLVRPGQEDDTGLLARIANRDPGDPKNDPYVAYEAYVRALAINTLYPSRSDDVLKALDQAFGPLEAEQEILDKQDRLATAARMILAATARQQAKAGKGATNDYLLANPFSSSDEAEQYFRLLTKVEAIVKAAEPDKPQEVPQHTFEVGLMLAALHQSKPDLGVAWPLASELAKLSDGDLDTNALPVLASCVRTHLLRKDKELATPADHKIAIRACTRIMKLLQSDEPKIDDTIVIKSYEPVLAKILEIADSFAKDVSEGNEQAIVPADLEDFYAALGRLIWARQFATWPLPKTSGGTAEKTEQLFGRAIEFHNLRPSIEPEKVAGYHLTRGHAELAKPDRNLDRADEHAAAVLKFTSDDYGARGLLSDINLRRSRQQLTIKNRLGFLETAISDGEKAVGGSPLDEPLLVTWRLSLGMAYLERANYWRDPSFETQKEDLDRSIEHAKEAVKLKSAYPDYPYLTLGNAYEDLAWLVRDDVEDNYKEAINSFLLAQKETYRDAQAWYGLGRCYYKIVADSYVDTSEWSLDDLKGLDAEKVMAKAGKLLSKATEEPSDLANALFYLGQVRLWQGDIAEAEKQFKRAMDAAYKKKLPEVGSYASSWVLMGLDAKTVESRLQELERDTGPLAGILRASARSIRIRSSVDDGLYGKALGEISQQLPDRSRAESEDVRMIQQNIRCRIGQLDNEVWSWDTAEQALEDAKLAVQLAFTRSDLAESFFLRGKVLEKIAQRVVESKDDTPEEFRGKLLSQFSDAISDYGDAIRLEPYPKPSMVPYLIEKSSQTRNKLLARRWDGFNLVFEKAVFARESKLGELSPDDVRLFIEELREGSQWADEFLRDTEISGTDKDNATDYKAKLEEERKKQSKILSPTP